MTFNALLVMRAYESIQRRYSWHRRRSSTSAATGRGTTIMSTDQFAGLAGIPENAAYAVIKRRAHLTGTVIWDPDQKKRVGEREVHPNDRQYQRW